MPLLPRQPPPDAAEDKGQRKKTMASSIGGSFVAGMMELAGIGLDQQLIIHAFNSAIVATSNMVRLLAAACTCIECAHVYVHVKCRHHLR